ncbi:amidohydrolase family protein [Flavihumibacter solisilvae]|uniref:Amidohydrolase n=1 Tax=Flavihumibacter solisilvae TaxID=1349421 RepID=A0A0C1L574_9BACT|nr:amidohydrolase family protein [Flavihumibacter solisilvae]KIC90788.1 amidohydrolase [Flavihumibacter solisilvae]
MKKTFFKIMCGLLLSGAAMSQETVYPAKEFKGRLYLKGATVHIGNGQVLENASILINNGKIEKIGKDVAPGDAKVIDITGKQVYPGLILSSSLLGLVEVNSVRATVDHTELGEINPSIRSVVAYNTDSKVTNTLKSNGILLANVVPQGGLISGSSSVVQLDAWNYEDAAYKMENGIHFRMPSLLNRSSSFFGAPSTQPPVDVVKRGLEQVEKAKSFFREAMAYANESKHAATNLKYEAVKGLFNKSQKLFIHCDIVKEMLVAVDFVKEFGMDVVIVGGSESYQIAPLLKTNNIAVIINQPHSLPTLPDDDVDQPYKTAAALQQAGVLFAINDEDGQTRGRNLPFNAGTAVAYGLTKEQALQAITLNAATILGVGDRTGSLEAGKDANIVVSEGDILDMRTSIITHAFIQGRQVDLTDKHKQLYERYKHKYEIN